MVSTKLFILCCLTWALFGQGSATANLTKNLDLDSLISNMFGNQGSSYPGNAQSYPAGVQNNPQYPNNLNNMNPGNNYPGYPSNAYQGKNPQYQRPGNGFNNVDPRYNYQGRPSSQGRYPQYQDPDNGNNNNYPGNNYPGNNYPGYYQGRPNQINNPRGNVWNNANENPGINYPGVSQFFPGSSTQGNPQYQDGGFSGNPSNGLPGNYRPNPGMGGNWNDVTGNPDFNYDPNGFYPNSGQRRPGTNWNNPNGYPNNQNPNQISVPGNQIQTQGVGSQGFDQQNPGLVQGQPTQYPQGHTYRPGLQNSGVFNPSQGSNGLNNQLPNLQSRANFKPTSNYPDQNGHLHKNGLNLSPTEKGSVLENPGAMSSQSITKSPRQIQCVQDCPSSSEYSPCCGTDYITYFNEEKVQCARKCGFDVKILRNGACAY